MSPLLSVTDSPFPMRAWLTGDLPPWVFPCLDCWVENWSGERPYRIATELFSQSTWLFFSLRKMLKIWVTTKSPALTEFIAIQLSVCYSKLNRRWEHVVIHSVDHPPSSWISKQCEHVQEALLDLLYSVIINLQAPMMQTSLNHSTCDYNTEESFTTMG